MPAPPVLLALLVLAAALPAPPPPAPFLDEDAPVARPAPLDADAVEAALLELARIHPRFTRVMPRRNGAGVPFLTLRDDPDRSISPFGLPEHTGLLLVGGLDGRRATDAEVLLGVARRLLDRPEDELAAALGDHMLVIVPRVNLGGTDASLGLSDGPRREQAGNGAPGDADRDGRIDEDGPDDLDGDGQITWMRIPDGTGEWVIDEHDPRAMRKAKRSEGERGTHRLQREGRDNDGDGDSGEDGTDGVQLDRNFPHGWAEHDAASGRFPLSEEGSAWLAGMLQHHPNLVGVLVVGDQDTLVSLPAKAKRVERSRWGNGFSAPLDGLLEEDLDTLGEFQRRFEKALDEDEHEVKAESMLDGSFLAWAYHHQGRWPLAVKTWAPPTKLPKAEGTDAKSGDADDADDADDAGDAGDAGDDDAAAETSEDGDDADADADPEAKDTDKPGSDPDSPVPAAVLAWLDEQGDADGFVPWTPFDHPDHGTVEIGGLAPGSSFDAPVEAVDALAERLTAFTLDVLSALPALAFEDLEVEVRGPGTYVVSAALVNTGALPTAPQFAADAATVRPIRVRLELPDGAALLNGPTQVLVPRLDGAGGRHELRWIVAANPGTRLVLSADADSVADIDTEVLLP